jgi:hypothetical protein
VRLLVINDGFAVDLDDAFSNNFAANFCKQVSLTCPALMSSAALILRPDGNALCAGVIFGAEYQSCSPGLDARVCSIGIICPSSSIEIFIRDGGRVHDLFVQTLHAELAVGIAASCMRLAPDNMFVVNSTIGLCCLGIHRADLQHFCEGILVNSVFVSTARGLSHTSTLSGGSDNCIPHDVYTCEGAWLWQRLGCFVDNATMRVRCVRPLLLSGLPLTSRREIQALLLPAAVPAMLPENRGWACGTSLPISPALAWMEQELEMTVDSMIAGRHDHVPCDFLEAIMPALALKPDCVFPSTAKQTQTSVQTINSSNSAALACAMRLSDIIQNVPTSAIEFTSASKTQMVDTFELMCSLMQRWSQRCRPTQRLWDVPDFASLSSNSHPSITNTSVLWPVAFRAAAGAMIAVLVKARSSSDKYPSLHTRHCSWHAADLCIISSHEATNFIPIPLGSTQTSKVVAALLQFCGHSISHWQPQSDVAFNEGLLLLQFFCGSCDLDSVMSAGTLHTLLEFTFMFLGKHAAQPTLGGGRRCGHQEQQHTANYDENQEKYRQFESVLECGIGICCNAIEVIHVRFSPMACRISASQASQRTNLRHACRLLDVIVSSPIKSNAPLVPFAQEFHSILTAAQLEHSIFPFFGACSHAFTMIAAGANASRSNFSRSCLVSSFFVLFLNAIDEAGRSLQGDNAVPSAYVHFFF